MGDVTSVPETMLERVCIHYTKGEPGPCFVVFGGLHGNEMSGPKALERVAHILGQHQPSIKGKFLGVLGNVAAMQRNVRFIDRDLNRGWGVSQVANLRAQDPSLDTPEDAEQRDLLAFLDSLKDETNQPVVFLDLHSTSADGLPFSCMPDTLTNLRIALTLPIPAVLGLEETIEGPMLGYLSDKGYRAVFVEAGQHDKPETADIQEAAIWVLLEGLGLMEAKDIPNFDAHFKRLHDLGHDLPRVLEIRYRQTTTMRDGFKMKPGYQHYDKVRAGEVLAENENGPIKSPLDGRVLMPSYQNNTEQGFFIAKDIPPLFVQIYFILRRLDLGRWAHLLPGAERSPISDHVLRVQRWVPQRLSNLIRLLGWRRMTADDDHVVLRRRYPKGAQGWRPRRRS